MKTGELCRNAGTYVTKCRHGHEQRIELRAGDTFPPCGERMAGNPCAAPVDWTLKPVRR